MTVSFADRLEQLRNEKQLSYQAIANEIGVSASTVSAWCKGKSKPSATNLDKLAAYLHVDKAFLETGESVSFTGGIHVKNDKEEVSVSVKDGIHVKNEKDEVHVSWKDGVKIVKDGQEQTKDVTFHATLGTVIGISVLVMYLVLGAFGLWHPGWLVFILWPVLTSLVEAIRSKNAAKFAYPMLVVFVYLFICFEIAPVWHPLWILFVTIPLYYEIIHLIQLKNQK